MKPLFLLFIIFLFYQSVSAKQPKVDWENYKNFSVYGELPNRKVDLDVSNKLLIQLIRDHWDFTHTELFSNPDFPLIDTVYKEIHEMPAQGRYLLFDTIFIKSICHYFDNAGNAELLYFYPNGQLKEKINFAATDSIFKSVWDNYEYYKGVPSNYGVVDGRVVEYYPSGAIKRIREYDCGILNGKSFTYFKNGQVFEAKEYLQGIPNGTFCKWYKDGALRDLYTLKNGEYGSFMNYLWKGYFYLKRKFYL